MRMVMVGGHTRNIGKTSVVEGIIKAMPEINWTAVKITQFGHGVCSVNGESCDCATAEHQFSITTERQLDSGTDTARFLAAGARRSLWVRTKQGELFTALASLKRKIEGDEFVIVESNSLRRFVTPELYLQVLAPDNIDIKLSAQQFFDLADAYLVVAGRHDERAQEGTLSVLLAREIKKKKPCFNVSQGERFMNRDVINFVRSKMVDRTMVNMARSNS